MYLLEQKGTLLKIKDIKSGVYENFTVNKNKNQKYNIHGVYGIIEFNGSEYLILIKNAKMVGNIHEKGVYEVSGVKVIVIKGVQEYSIIKSIYDFFEIPGIFFSEFDLSKRYGDLLALHNKETTFLFNEYPLSIYANRHTHFGVKCIQGYFEQWGKLCLVSRKCPKRVGARYFSRGCDIEGYCSNFVETEQIIEKNSSYLHLRGSMPFLWGHNLGLKYAPEITFPGKNITKYFLNNQNIKKELLSNQNITKEFLSNQNITKEFLSNQKKIFEKADNFLKREYKSKITYLNLIKEKGYEKKLFDVYKNLLDNVKVIHYDFHNKINRIEIPAPILEINGFSTEKTLQQEIIRTNCIDCLDRTNSMQFIIGEKVLEKQLSHFREKDTSSKILENQSKIDLKNKAEFMKAFRTMFFNNGNYLSIQYAGTPALLSTYILKNQSVIFGKLKDFYYSLLRYWINRAQHGRVQTSYDIITGKLKTGKILYHRNRVNNILILLWSIFLIYSFLKNKKYMGKSICLFYSQYLIIRCLLSL